MIGAWEFFQRENGRWSWRFEPAAAQAAKESSDSFNTRSECIVDAMDHGYLTHTGTTMPPWQSR
jgi:hypothetical protein